MPKRKEKDLITKLAERGEEAIEKLAHAPGADRVVEAAKDLRDRVEELQRRTLGIDALEKRVADLERRLDELQGVKPKRTLRRRSPAKPKAAA